MSSVNIGNCIKTSAIIVLNLDEKSHISQNSTEYWISNPFLDADFMKISKNSIEGKQLQIFIEDRYDVKFIKEWIETKFVKHCEPKYLINLVHNALKVERHNGARDAREAIREALGIRI